MPEPSLRDSSELPAADDRSVNPVQPERWRVVSSSTLVVYQSSYAPEACVARRQNPHIVEIAEEAKRADLFETLRSTQRARAQRSGATSHRRLCGAASGAEYDRHR